MTRKIDLDNIAIVLQRPRFPENIGAAARAARNMGIRQLIVVAPENFAPDKIAMMATHAAGETVAAIERHEDLAKALGPFNYVIGTTARTGKQRQVIGSPARLAQFLIPISQDNKIAIVFGPEDRGLSNEDLSFCHQLLNIPTADFSSINLAQAVMIVCYELFMATREDAREFVPRLAARHELDAMYDQLKDILVRISCINPENPDFWMRNIRRFFTRLQLRAREVSIIRGVCRQIDWYGGKCYQDGLLQGRGELSCESCDLARPEPKPPGF